MPKNRVAIDTVILTKSYCHQLGCFYDTVLFCDSVYFVIQPAQHMLAGGCRGLQPFPSLGGPTDLTMSGTGGVGEAYGNRLHWAWDCLRQNF